jgi:hypothetical protein
LAAYYKNFKFIEWLTQNPKFDFNMKNRFGDTELEQLVLSGHVEIASQIKKNRPEALMRKILIKSKNKDGSPIYDFVRFESGSFMMGDDQDKNHVTSRKVISDRNKVLTTITRPFELFSIPTTFRIYKEVLELLLKKYGDEYAGLKDDNFHFSATYVTEIPIHWVSYPMVKHWLEGLTHLSSLDDSDVQENLKILFPNHKKGAVYRLPTSAEWEYAARLGGVAEGNYSYGHSQSEVDLIEHLIYYKSSNHNLQPVGLKKPVFYNGKPIYDLQGTIWVWTEDWFSDKLIGGTDPKGPIFGPGRVLRGGGWNDSLPSELRSGNRVPWLETASGMSVGFRIVRSMK